MSKPKPKFKSRFKKGHQINSKGGLDKRLRISTSDELLQRLKLAYDVDAAFRLIPMHHRSFSDWCRASLAAKADLILGPKSRGIPAGDPRPLPVAKAG